MRAHDHLPERWNPAAWFVGRHVADGRGEEPALVTDDGVLSYAGLDASVRRMAAALVAAGVHRGDRVAIILPDTPLHAAAFWGTLALGGIAVPLNPLLRPHEHRAILADCDPRVVIYSPAMVSADTVAVPDALAFTETAAAV